MSSDQIDPVSDVGYTAREAAKQLVLLEDHQIALLVPGVAGQVFGAVKLRGIHKNADQHRQAVGGRTVHKG
jgi:hypothetical protein